MPCDHLHDGEGNHVATICRPGPTEVIHREALGDRWCFICRARLPYEFVVWRETDPMSYYGPTPAFRCSRCGHDGLLFPGRERVWAE